MVETSGDSNPNSTGNCTYMVLVPPSFTALLGGVSLLNVATNLMLICSVRLTPSLRGNTGGLMVNEQVSSLLYQLSFACGLIFSSDLYTIFVFMAIGKGFRLACTVFLTLQNFNMYFAVCRPTSTVFTRFKSKGYSLGLVLFTWTLAAVYNVLLMQDIFLSTSCLEGTLKITFHREGLWIPVFLSIYGVCLPFASNIFCLVKVYKKLSSLSAVQSFSQTNWRLQTMKRARFIFGNSIVLSMINVTFTTFNTVIIFTASAPSVVQAGFATCSALLLIYITFRPLIYYTCYKPLWDATKQFFCRNTRPRTINIEVLPIG